MNPVQCQVFNGLVARGRKPLHNLVAFADVCV